MFADKPVAIVDIGSNSVRLVVYSGATRIPSVIFNEKVMAGLGRGLGAGGTFDPAARRRALAALGRFALLTEQMQVAGTRTVATAAVREAADGSDFLRDVRALGLEPEILSGKEEARLAGLGVLSAIPDADGLVGDLGGGSLELVEVGEGEVRHSASLPLGVLRLDALVREGSAAFARTVAGLIEQAGFADWPAGRPFYLVGGSWRALARYDMLLAGHPLPITQQHEMAPDRPLELAKPVAKLDRESVRDIPSLSPSRVPTLPHANALLAALVERLRPDRLVVSSFGIREGLLYDGLAPRLRALDPLIEATREAGAGLGRFAQHGDLIDRWIAPAFDDDARQARLRLAACMLADIAWAAHPDFRAERGIDMALHGNWVAIDAPGRAMLAQALFTSFGGGGDFPYPAIAALCGVAERERAARWGLAIRLAQRLSGGVAAGLERSRLERRDGALRLRLPRGDGAMVGEAGERRLRALATALGLRHEILPG